MSQCRVLCDKLVSSSCKYAEWFSDLYYQTIIVSMRFGGMLMTDQELRDDPQLELSSTKCLQRRGNREPQQRHCCMCNRGEVDDEGESPIKLRACGRCKISLYCGRECQVKHWKTIHKTQCKKVIELNAEEPWVFIAVVGFIERCHSHRRTTMIRLLEQDGSVRKRTGNGDLALLNE